MPPVSSASTAAGVQPLRFAPEASASQPSLGNGMVIAAIMTVAIVVAFAWLRYRARQTRPAETAAPRWKVSQRLRLGPASSATFVRGDTGEWMIVESRGQVVVTAVGDVATGRDAP